MEHGGWYQIISYEKIETENGVFLCYHTMEKERAGICPYRKVTVKESIMVRKHGKEPYHIVVLHGGPGAAGSAFGLTELMHLVQ